MNKPNAVKTQRAKADDFAQIAVAIKRHIELLVTSAHDLQAAPGHLESIARLLESLPLATQEFDLAGIRLRNARRYFQSDEIGAARYELRLLRGQLSPFTISAPCNLARISGRCTS